MATSLVEYFFGQGPGEKKRQQAELEKAQTLERLRTDENIRQSRALATSALEDARYQKEAAKNEKLGMLFEMAPGNTPDEKRAWAQAKIRETALNPELATSAEFGNRRTAAEAVAPRVAEAATTGQDASIQQAAAQIANARNSVIAADAARPGLAAFTSGAQAAKGLEDTLSSLNSSSAIASGLPAMQAQEQVDVIQSNRGARSDALRRRAFGPTPQEDADYQTQLRAANIAAAKGKAAEANVAAENPLSTLPAPLFMRRHDNLGNEIEGSSPVEMLGIKLPTSAITPAQPTGLSGALNLPVVGNQSTGPQRIKLKKTQ